MKIRIKGNSIRFRLNHPEVEQLAIDRPITENVDFGATSLTYSVSCKRQQDFSVTFIENLIELQFPAALLYEWQTTDKVGYEAHFGALAILIEKDFTCLDNTIEDQSDNYPNPLIATKK